MKVLMINGSPHKEGKRDSHNNRHMMVNKLMELDKAVCDDLRIPAIYTIEKMRPEYKNKKNRKA